jgi:pyruvate,water dikinase
MLRLLVFCFFHNCWEDLQMKNGAIVSLSAVSMDDVDIVGGKGASLGEMIQRLSDAGVPVPGGFAITAQAYFGFLKEAGLDNDIEGILSRLDTTEDISQLEEVGKQIRSLILNTPFSSEFEKSIMDWYEALDKDNVAVAVRSSATAEDLPNASFAGQQETYLNVRGKEVVVLAVKRVYASLFTARAISYRATQGFDLFKVGMSAIVQRMVRSGESTGDIKGVSGVMFTCDTESGHENVIVISASYGLGEPIVQGAITPDEYRVVKRLGDEERLMVLSRSRGSKESKMVFATPSDGEVLESYTKMVPTSLEERNSLCLSDAEVLELARMAMAIEKHYGRRMDIEWAKDGVTGKLFILQARPETVRSQKDPNVIETYFFVDPPPAVPLLTGQSVGEKIACGPVRICRSLEDARSLPVGGVLVTDMTDPDWEPIMKRASAIVTNRGSRTCHAAIISRELGIPAVVGTGNATEVLKNESQVTVCCKGSQGLVYDGIIRFDISITNISHLPKLPVDIMVNVGNPGNAFAASRLPVTGVGLARLEFIIAHMIGIHPKAALEYHSLPFEIQSKIRERIAGHADDPVEFYIKKMVEGIATIAAAFYPRKVIVRTSDFKSNEYANLVGGELFEPLNESNPMIGFRGARRYLHLAFREAFELECRALKIVRDEMGLTNVEIMIPFVRTLEEAKAVTDLLKQNGLERGKNDLRLIMMCEVPSNALRAKDFLKHFDGFSIGSNDLTQLTLGMDRDSEYVAGVFDEQDPAVLDLIAMAIRACVEEGKYIGICGQGPSDHPALAQMLVEKGIKSMSLNADSVLPTFVRFGELYGNSQSQEKLSDQPTLKVVKTSS